MLNLVPWRTI